MKMANFNFSVDYCIDDAGKMWHYAFCWVTSGDTEGRCDVVAQTKTYETEQEAFAELYRLLASRYRVKAGEAIEFPGGSKLTPTGLEPCYAN